MNDLMQRNLQNQINLVMLQQTVLLNLLIKNSQLNKSVKQNKPAIRREIGRVIPPRRRSFSKDVSPTRNPQYRGLTKPKFWTRELERRFGDKVLDVILSDRQDDGNKDNESVNKQVDFFRGTTNSEFKLSERQRDYKNNESVNKKKPRDRSASPERRT